jgi:hypothetical protein
MPVSWSGYPVPVSRILLIHFKIITYFTVSGSQNFNTCRIGYSKSRVLDISRTQVKFKKPKPKPKNYEKLLNIELQRKNTCCEFLRMRIAVPNL